MSASGKDCNFAEWFEVNEESLYEEYIESNDLPVVDNWTAKEWRTFMRFAWVSFEEYTRSYPPRAWKILKPILLVTALCAAFWMGGK